MNDYKVTNLVGTPTDYSNRNNWVHLPETTDKEVTHSSFIRRYISIRRRMPLPSCLSRMKYGRFSKTSFMKTTWPAEEHETKSLILQEKRVVF